MVSAMLNILRRKAPFSCGFGRDLTPRMRTVYLFCERTNLVPWVDRWSRRTKALGTRVWRTTATVDSLSAGLHRWLQGNALKPSSPLKLMGLTKTFQGNQRFHKCLLVARYVKFKKWRFKDRRHRNSLLLCCYEFYATSKHFSSQPLSHNRKQGY